MLNLVITLAAVASAGQAEAIQSNADLYVQASRFIDRGGKVPITDFRTKQRLSYEAYMGKRKQCRIKLIRGQSSRDSVSVDWICNNSVDQMIADSFNFEKSKLVSISSDVPVVRIIPK